MESKCAITTVFCWIIWINLPFVCRASTNCGYPGSMSHSKVSFSPTGNVSTATEAYYSCEPGFELFGPHKKTCLQDGTWTPLGLAFCLVNVALGKPSLKSWGSGYKMGLKAVDGDVNSCTEAHFAAESKPWFFVNVLEPFNVKMVRIDFGEKRPGNGTRLTVRVGNSRPDRNENPICGEIEEDVAGNRTVFVGCEPKQWGAFVSLHVQGATYLSICEVFVFTDEELPIESCPLTSDLYLGSVAPFSGKCYSFYNRQLTHKQSLKTCRGNEGGTLIDEGNAILQGFLSWQMTKRHRTNPNRGQYWLGATRFNGSTWTWPDERVVNTSFWLPGSRESKEEKCSRLDGTKRSRWVETNCDLSLLFICQNKPTGCGRPAQPPNSTLNATEFNLGTTVLHSCDPGLEMDGPSTRTCMQNGRYSQYPPYCQYKVGSSPVETSKNDSAGFLFSQESIKTAFLGAGSNAAVASPSGTTLGTGEVVTISIFGAIIVCLVVVTVAVVSHRCRRWRKQMSAIDSFNSATTYESSQTAKQIESQISTISPPWAKMRKEEKSRGLTL